MKVSSARFDIEALRAFAVSVVILFHAGLASIPGGFIGVDVFFVISGYLIIGALYREYTTEGRILILDFWGRRARRLLPAASTVILVSLIFAYIISGPTVLRDIQYDLVAAAFYVANFRFGLNDSNYWAPDYISPVLHYWSLSVEEQFYIFIPIAVLVAHLILWKVPVRYINRGFQGLIWLTLIASFIFAIGLVSVDPIAGYYNSIGRAWEFAFGGLVAITSARIRLPWKQRTWILGFLWAALIATAFVINETMAYPGYSTLVPVVLTTLILWIGAGSKSIAAVELEESPLKPLKLFIAKVGTHSYSLYLWHWPVLWFIGEIWGGENSNPNALSLPLALIGIVATIGLAYLTKRYIEDPIRFQPRLVKSSLESLRTGFRWTAASVSMIGIISLLPVVAIGAGPGNAEPLPSATSPEVKRDSAQAWFEDLIQAYAPEFSKPKNLKNVKPELSEVTSETPSSREDGCHAEFLVPEPTKRCTYGVEGSDTLVYLFGDSHAQHYMDGMAAAAESAGIELRIRTRSSCPAVNVTIWMDQLNGPYTLCDVFRRDVFNEIKEAKPDLVIMSNLLRTTIVDRETDQRIVLKSKAAAVWAEQYEATIKRFTRDGIKVVVFRDTPQWGFEPADCLAAYDVAECRINRGAGIDDINRDAGIANQIDGALGLDPLSLQCGPKSCYAVRDKMVMMRDNSHITRTYSLALTPLWEKFFEQILPKWDELQASKQQG